MRVCLYVCVYVSKVQYECFIKPLCSRYNYVQYASSDFKDFAWKSLLFLKIYVSSFRFVLIGKLLVTNRQRRFLPLLYILVHYGQRNRGSETIISLTSCTAFVTDKAFPCGSCSWLGEVLRGWGPAFPDLIDGDITILPTPLPNGVR